MKQKLSSKFLNKALTIVHWAYRPLYLDLWQRPDLKLILKRSLHHWYDKLKTSLANMFWRHSFPFHQNSSLVLSFGCIATGGDDATVRIWNVDTSVTPANIWKVDKVFELKGHTAAITSLREHPTETWVRISHWSHHMIITVINTIDFSYVVQQRMDLVRYGTWKLAHY